MLCIRGTSHGPVPCVRLSQVGVLSKRLNESSWFLTCELPSTHPTLQCVKRKFGYLISGRNNCQHVVSTRVAGCDRSLSRVSKGARANNCHGPRLAKIRHCLIFILCNGKIIFARNSGGRLDFADSTATPLPPRIRHSLPDQLPGSARARSRASSSSAPALD